jgi:hypothetical protein
LFNPWRLREGELMSLRPQPPFVPLGRTSRSPQTFSIPLSALIAIRGKAAILYSDFSVLTQGPLSQGGDFVLSSTAAPDHNGQQSNPDGSPLCGESARSPSLFVCRCVTLLVRRANGPSAIMLGNPSASWSPVSGIPRW